MTQAKARYAEYDFEPEGQDTDFELDGAGSDEEFALEAEVVETDSFKARQFEIYLPLQNPEQPEANPQLEFEIPRPVHWVEVSGQPQKVKFQYASTLLESLEAQGVQVPYQCRDGYCGSCRTTLLAGEVAYLQEPMAWLNDGEVLPCCCVPKSNLSLKIG
ncbi:class I ribonucleotide reductase maintenance protein YfaE [Gynuella sunshinyii]|uniref:Ferredoxin n=1 Tax=Gynuella sunshinyii YC6258 TaxID=1445510 RepID=A0A0C5VKY2_9GAMM|nr:class I ribonucleotide reductase maintenance protein YfaE [Gynuella sunshinyii]AJQ94043.1 ferredoxin [Gynuella sunshinyii YC6258]